MEEKAVTSESDVFGSELATSSLASLCRRITRSFGLRQVPRVELSLTSAYLTSRLLVLFCCVGIFGHSAARGDAGGSAILVVCSTAATWKGSPYAYPDPRSPRDVTGFEVELMARLGKDLGVADSRRGSGTSCYKSSIPAESISCVTATNGPRREHAITWRRALRITSIGCS